VRGRAFVHALSAALVLSWSTPAVALAPPRCPKKADAAPPAEALELKNVAQDMRSAEAWQKASRYFRDAARALPACSTFADERLRWTLWAIEAFEHTRAPADDELRGFVDEQIEVLAPEADRLADHSQLLAARERLAPAPAAEPEPVPGDRPSPPPASRGRNLGIGLAVSGGVLLVAGAVVGGVFAARARGLADELNGAGGRYDQLAAAGCNGMAAGSECDGLRGGIAELRDDGRRANTIAVVGISLAVVGVALAATGIGLTLRARKDRRAAAVRALPQWGGLVLSGQF